MVKPLTDERRKAIRAKRVLSIQYRLVKPKGRARTQGAPWYLSTTHDMSVDGLSFLSEVPYQISDVLELHVVMSGILDIFKGYGEVVRIEKKETGAYYLIALRFVSLKTPSSRSKVSARPKIRNRVRKNTR